MDQTAPVESLDYLKQLSLTRMKQCLYIKFSPDAKAAYEKQKADFFAANTTEGEESEKDEKRVLDGFEPLTLLHDDENG